MKIAVYSPNWVGDAALSLPFIHSVKEKYPNSEIIIICKEWVHSVYQNNPNIDKIMTILTKDSRGMLKTFQLGFLLRKEDIKIFYTLIQNDIDPEIILRKEIINIKEKIEIKEKIKKLKFEEFEKEEIKQILFDN